MPNSFWDQIPGGYRGGLASPTTEVNTGANQSDYWSNYFRDNAGVSTGKGSFGSGRGGFGGGAQNPFQTGNQDQARLQQQQVIQDLQIAARGDPNSRAQQQLQQGYGAAQSQQSSLGSTMRGQSAGAAQRGIQAGQQGIQRGFAGDQQMLQVQEQQAAQQMLAQLLTQQQGQDIAQAQGMAQGALGTAGLDDAMRQFYTGAGIATDTANQQLRGERGRANLGFDLEGRNIDDQLNQQLMGLASGAAGTAASIYGSKTNNGGYRQVDGQNSIVPYDDK